jgi:dethiobiotin synthetase
MSAVIVTGVGTDVGKTYVSCALLRHWRAQGIRCAPLKPVLSGFDDASLLGSDAAALLIANGQEATPAAIAAISPWRYRAPLAPPAAAKLEGRTLAFEAIAKFCRDAIAANSGATTLVETAGGVMSPLTQDRTMLDLVVALAAPVILVAGTYLGAVSHTLTAIEALKSRGQQTALLVINESVGGVGLNETREMLSSFQPSMETIAIARGGGAPAYVPSFQ